MAHLLAQIWRTAGVTDEDQIEQFVRERGVTRCAVAACAETTATIPPEAVAAHRARGLDPVGDGWRRKKSFGWAAYWQRRKRAEAAT